MTLSLQRVFSFIALGLLCVHPVIYPFSVGGGIGGPHPMSEREFLRWITTEWPGTLIVAVLGLAAATTVCLPWCLPAATLAQRRLLQVSLVVALSSCYYLVVFSVNFSPAAGLAILGFAYALATFATFLPKSA